MGTWGADSEYVLTITPSASSIAARFSFQMPAQHDSISLLASDHVMIIFASSDTTISNTTNFYPWQKIDLTPYINGVHDSLAGRIYFGDTVAYHICFVRE